MNFPIEVIPGWDTVMGLLSNLDPEGVNQRTRTLKKSLQELGSRCSSPGHKTCYVLRLQGPNCGMQTIMINYHPMNSAFIVVKMGMWSILHYTSRSIKTLGSIYINFIEMDETCS